MTERLQVVGWTLRLAFRADPRVAGLITFLVVAEMGSVALVALSQKWIVNHAGVPVDGGLVLAALLGGVAYAAMSAGGRIQFNLMVDLAEKVDLQLSQEVLTITSRIPTIGHLEDPVYLDRLQVLRRGTGDLAASCWSAAQTLAAVVSLGLSVWLLADVNPPLALLALLGVPPLLFASRSQSLVRAAVNDTAEASRQEQMLHDLCTKIEPAKEVRIARSGEEISDRADRLWEGIVRRQVSARVRGTLWMMAGWACYGVGFAVAVWLVTHMAVVGSASVGDVVLVAALGSRLKGQIADAASSASELAAATNIVDHYVWLTRYARRFGGGGAPLPPRLAEGITLTGIGFSYPGARDAAVRGIDLRIPAGAIVGLVGENGAGKSTLVKLLTGLYAPTEGTLTVNGRPIGDYAVAAWSTRLGGSFQDFVKFEMVVRETVGIGDLERIEDVPAVRSAVDKAGAGELVASMPDGYRTQLGIVFDGAELSHGEWQKLALARGLMRDEPLLIVLDEPTAALDPLAEHEMFERVIALAREAAAARGAIAILVSHRFSTLHMADRIVVMSDGRISEEGTHQELLASGGSYATLYRAQAMAYR